MNISVKPSMVDKAVPTIVPLEKPFAVRNAIAAAIKESPVDSCKVEAR